MLCFNKLRNQSFKKKHIEQFCKINSKYILCNYCYCTIQLLYCINYCSFYKVELQVTAVRQCLTTSMWNTIEDDS